MLSSLAIYAAPFFRRSDAAADTDILMFSELIFSAFILTFR